MKLAIVGCGPKGLYALERLVAWAEASGGRHDLELTVFEPHSTPGAGPAYDPALPPYLLMNYPAAKIDLAHPTPPHARGGESFSGWADADRKGFPPRAEVGRYLNHGFERLRERSPLPIELVPAWVTSAHREADRWILGAGGQEYAVDEVLMALGHYSSRPFDLGRATPGAKIAMRGLGLTAIDLMLGLTEGRGGSFVGSIEAGLTYQPSSREPEVIRPWSRTGRPMLVKSGLPAELGAPPALAIAGESARLVGLPGAIGVDQLIVIVAALGERLLQLAEPDGIATGVEPWLGAAASGELPQIRDAQPALAASLAIATGAGVRDLNWALGVAWREIYPALVRRLSHGGLASEDRGSFARLTVELERVAFGPPPATVAKILALREAGLVDLGDTIRPAEPSEVEIDAVISAPGLHPQQEPLDDLLAAGAISVPPGCRGIEVGRDAACIGTDGRPTPGLSAVGRVTEDWIVGNDTLSRSLHPEIDRWAARICSDTGGSTLTQPARAGSL